MWVQPPIPLVLVMKPQLGFTEILLINAHFILADFCVSHPLRRIFVRASKCAIVKYHKNVFEWT